MPDTSPPTRNARVNVVTAPPALRCTATTKRGTPCRAWALHDRNVCLAHADRETRDSVGFVADNGFGGRPALPKVTDLLRERVEARADEILDAMFAALEADRAIVVGNGPGAFVTTAPEHAVRLAAARDLLDRVYGRPKQTTEVSGPEGGPIEVVDYSRLSQEEIDFMEAAMAKAVVEPEEAA